MHFGPEDVEMLETVQVGDALTGLKARQVDVASGTIELTIEPRSTSQFIMAQEMEQYHALPHTSQFPAYKDTTAVPCARGYTGVIVCIDNDDIWMDAFCLSQKAKHKCILRPKTVQVGDATTGL